MCWDNGLVLDAPGGKIELVFGARFLYDLAWFGQDDALEAGFGDIANDTEIRRASITIDGKLGGRIEFRFSLILPTLTMRHGMSISASSISRSSVGFASGGRRNRSD